MAPAAKGTPGRRKRPENKFFEPGKVGRKTGITLKDTGVRDEFGLEPVSGIFSSPESPKRNGNKTLSSSDMLVQDSSAPEPTETITLRKTPRLPPPRTSTPKHTNIGSPIRQSSTRPGTRGQSVPEEPEKSPSTRTASQPPANRLLKFESQSVHKSIEPVSSPFRPKNKLRRSIGTVRKDPFTLEVSPENTPQTPDAQTNGILEDGVEEEVGVEAEQPKVDVDDYQLFIGEDASIETQEEGEEEDAHAEESMKPPPKRKPGRPRKSDISNDSSVQRTAPDATVVDASSGKHGRFSLNSHIGDVSGSVDGDASLSQVDATVDAGPPQKKPRVQRTAPIADTVDSSSRKRGRTSLNSHTGDVSGSVNGDASLSQIDATEDAGPPQKKPRGRLSKDRVIVHQDDGEATIDPAPLAHGDSYLADGGGEDGLGPLPILPKKKKGGRKGKAAMKDSDPNAKLKNVRMTGSPVKLNDSPSKLRLSPSKRGESRGASLGPISNVNLRASTPFEDAGPRVSRYGRPVMQPLKYWANEGLIYKNGEIEGVVRAEEVEVLKSKTNRRKTTARKGKKRGKPDTVDEESETESIMPDDWEDQLGVIAGMVAPWDAQLGAGDVEREIKEDLAFASSALVTREVAGSAFRYAKIMTLPFFGSGVVELPPEGFKRAKNSRRMQMVFFVHEGKVLVQVGPAGTEGNEFAISKGGVWVVPRGNNYAITNESRTTTARVFFAQGCEVDIETNAA